MRHPTIATPPALPMMLRLLIATPRRAWLSGLAVVLLLVFVVYLPTIDDYFGGDDFMVLAPVRAMGPWELIWKSFVFRDDIPYWRPLVSPIYAFEVHVFGLRPWPYHVVVIALHLVNVALVAAIARAITGRRWVALAAALIFGIYPAKTTTVPMISSTVELFAMVWYLLTVLCCIRFARGGGRLWYWLGLTAFVLGLLTKESAATAAAAATLVFLFLGLMPAWRNGRPVLRGAGRLALRVAPFWLLVAPYTAITFSSNLDDPSGYARVMYFVGPHIGRNLWWFLARLAAPFEIGHGPHVSPAGHAGAALLLLLGAWLLVRGPNGARLLVLWTVVALTPLALWRPELLVGRFTYMATAPYAILLALAGAWLAERLAQVLPRAVPRRAPAAALATAAVIACTALTLDQSSERTREGEMYEVLVTSLLETHPSLPSESEIVLENGVWSGPFHAVFLNSVADTLYGPDRVRIVNVERPRERPHYPTRRLFRLHYDDGELQPGDGGVSD